jgi:diguanylate cyclase (GGDEF)-like protein/PAS domain S-box-containing protein
VLRLRTTTDHQLSPPVEGVAGSSTTAGAAPGSGPRDRISSAGVEAALDRLRQLLDEEPDYIFWKDVDSVYRGCNQRFAEAAGLASPAEIVGKTDFDLAWTNGEADFYREVDHRVMANDAPEYHIIESQLQADGRRVWIDTSKVPYYDATGRVAGLLGVYSDVTTRVESAKLLSQGAEIFRAMSFAARSMVERGEWTDSIERVLEALGRAVEVSRVTLFSIHGGIDDHLLRHRFEWVAEGFEPRRERPELQNVPMRKVGLARLLDELVAGRCVHVRVRELGGSERRILEDQRVLSVVTAPLTVDDRLWGFIEFDDCTTERQWLTAEIEALRSAAGIIAAAIQRRRVERALRLEKRRFEQLFENTPLAILMSDADDNVVSVNPAFERLFGFARTDVIGQQINELITPPERADEATWLSRRTFSGETVGQATVRRRRDGTPVPVQVFGVPVIQDSSVALVYGIYVDQTDRLRAEAALRESEEKFRSLAEQSLQGIFVVKSGRIAYANRMMAEITGYPLNELLGFSQTAFESIIHPADRSFAIAAANRFELGDGRVGPQTEYRLITKPGAVKWVLQQTRTVRFDGELGVEGVLVDITKRKHAEEQLLQSALHDSLTGLPNRASFHDRVELALERSRGRAEAPFAVLFLDLDRFKLINDGYGHQTGDRLLVEIAHRLRRAVRPGDTVARLGGDEFTVLIPDVRGPDEAVSVAQRIHAALAKPFRIGDQEVFTSASTGIAISSPRYDSPDEILRDADIAMYQAKGEGRARHHLYDESMHPQVLTQLHLENDLRRALERDELVLHYQPIVDTTTGRIVACEALLRWRHPERGLLPPGEFLSLAVDTGLTNPIGQWVVRTGVRQAAAWFEAYGEGSPAVSLNLFSHQFSQPEIAVFVEQVLAEFQLPADRLQLEITESAVIEVPELAIGVMQRLRNLGVKLYLDDFGTGYSSLAYLQRFAIDTMKIDRGFIQRLGTNGGGVEIVRTIVTLARNLGMEALAEGIESPEQLALVRELGCTYGQGFWLARPMPAQEATAVIERGPMTVG